MKRYITILLALVLPLTVAACGIEAKGEESNGTVQSQETHQTHNTNDRSEAGFEPGLKKQGIPVGGQQPRQRQHHSPVSAGSGAERG